MKNNNQTEIKDTINKYIYDVERSIQNLDTKTNNGNLKNYCDSRFDEKQGGIIKLKDGGLIDLNKDNNIVSKKIILNRSNLYGVAQEVIVLKELGLYRGHYVEISSDSIQLFVLQKGFFDNWHSLCFDEKNSTFQNAVDNNIVQIAKLAAQQMSILFNKGFYHRDLNNEGNLLLQFSDDSFSEVVDVQLIDFDRSIPIDSFPATHAVPQTSYDFYTHVSVGFDVNTEDYKSSLYEQHLELPCYVNKITEATDLYRCLRSKLSSELKTNSEILNNIKKEICKEYLFDINLSSSNDSKIKRLIKDSDLLSFHTDIICLDSNKELKAFKGKFANRQKLINCLKNNSIFRDIMNDSDLFQMNYIIALPHTSHNFFGSSSSRVDVVILDFNGKEVDRKVYSINDNWFYKQGLFGRYGRLDEKQSVADFYSTFDQKTSLDSKSPNLGGVSNNLDATPSGSFASSTPLPSPSGIDSSPSPSGIDSSPSPSGSDSSPSPSGSDSPPSPH